MTELWQWFLSWRRTAATQGSSVAVYYLILHHTQAIFFGYVSQLFLVNPDQLACQGRVTDTTDLKAISRPAA